MNKHNPQKDTRRPIRPDAAHYNVIRLRAIELEHPTIESTITDMIHDRYGLACLDRLKQATADLMILAYPWRGGKR